MPDGGIADLPSLPGVYLFREGGGKVLYVGKAKRLRRRVRSYFRPAGSLPFRSRSLVQRAAQVEALVVRSEREALLLEASLIRRYRPRYNQRLKDGRGYPFLRIDLQAPAPGAALTRTLRDDGAAYFGPFPEAGRVREVLEVIRRLYLVRAEAFGRDHARLRADRRRMASDLLDLTTGQSRSVQDRIERAMHEAASALDFERAGRLRAALDACAELACAPRVDPRRDAPEPPRVRARITVALPCSFCGAP